MATVSASPATTTLTPPSSSHGNGYPWDNSPPRAPEVSDINGLLVSSNATARVPYPDLRPADQRHASDEGRADFVALDAQNAIANRKSTINNDHTNGFPRSPSALQNGTLASFTSNGMDSSPPLRKDSRGESQANAKGMGYLSPPPGADAAKTEAKEVIGPAENPGEPNPNKRGTAELYGADPDDVSSKWIHRDKLARIENEELQAAGIILPKGRARSKPRRDLPIDKANGFKKPGEGDSVIEQRSRKNSFAMSEPQTPDTAVPSWDLRLPEEVAADSNPYFVLNTGGGKGTSRLPVAKLSPVPIPVEHIERDTPKSRKRDSSPGAEDSISYPKSRSRSDSLKTSETAAFGATPQPRRSVTDASPKKNAAGARKTSAPAKSGSVSGRPKTRSGPSKDSTNSSSSGQTRPTTRSGERDLSPGAMSKQPEGEPPWMVSAYRPDPRLPPDQQLLPTVARRLQQEKWEREGKFGNIYDKEFRPLTDEGFLKPPESTEKTSGTETEITLPWPLKADVRSPTPAQGRTGSYSTIPKIQEKPNVSPLPSPRGAVLQADGPAVQRVPDFPDEAEQKKGCGCCIVM